MVNVDDVTHEDLDLITQHCIEETQKFYRQFANDTRYCFELLRRAYSDLVEEALAKVYYVYLPILVSRAKHHGLFYASCQDAEYFARLALTRFYNANHGEKFLQKFLKLESVIAYLYICLHTVIAHDVRTNSPIISLDDNLVSGDALDETQFDVQDLWRHIRSLLTDAEEIRLAYLRFVLTMTPAEIVLSYPNMWKDERAVSVSLQRIRRKLRKDQYLRGLAGFSSETDPSDE